jgi:hypothetical protein
MLGVKMNMYVVNFSCAHKREEEFVHCAIQANLQPVRKCICQSFIPNFQHVKSYSFFFCRLLQFSAAYFSFFQLEQQEEQMVWDANAALPSF